VRGGGAMPTVFLHFVLTEKCQVTQVLPKTCPDIVVNLGDLLQRRPKGV